MHVGVVVNPKAGAHRRRLDLATIQALVTRAAAGTGTTVQVECTRGRGGGRTATRTVLEAGADLVIAWGGDGTINEVAGVLTGTEIPLGIVPAGSGNGLARDLGIPRRPGDALRLAFLRRVRHVDVAVLADRIFVNVAGFGFDGALAERFNAGSQRRGRLWYAILTLQEMLRHQVQRYEVCWDGGRFEGTALMVAVANSRQYGSGAWIAPRARLDDGALDLVIVQPSTVIGDLWRARKLFTHTILEDRRVTFAQVRHVTVRSEVTLRAHVDGEAVVNLSEAELYVRPGALRVCAGP